MLRRRSLTTRNEAIEIDFAAFRTAARAAEGSINDAYLAGLCGALRAPFRVHRPEPDWEGVSIGHSEGLPGDILRRIKERGEHYEG